MGQVQTVHQTAICTSLLTKPVKSEHVKSRNDTWCQYDTIDTAAAEK